MAIPPEHPIAPIPSSQKSEDKENEIEEIAQSSLVKLSLSAPEKRVQVIVCTKIMGGFGDLMSGLYLIDYITKLGIGADIVFAIDFSEKASREEIEKYMAFARANAPLLIKVVRTEKVNEFLRQDLPKISIGVATVFQKPALLSSEILFVALAEYSDMAYHRLARDLYVMGIGPKEIGVFINKDLRDFAALRLREEERLRVIDPSIKYLLGIDDSYHIKHKFFFGYSAYPSAQIRFIFDLIAMEIEDKDIDVMLVCKHGFEINEEIINAIGERGIKKIEIIEEDKRTIIDPPQLEGIQTTKTLRIFIKKRVSHSTFLSCLKGSEKVTLLTGDQSLFEGIALDKLVIYETLTHKERLFANLVQFAHRHNLPRVVSFFELTNIDDNDTKTAQYHFFDLEALEREFEAFSKAICEEKDVTSFLKDQIQRIVT